MQVIRKVEPWARLRSISGSPPKALPSYKMSSEESSQKVKKAALKAFRSLVRCVTFIYILFGLLSFLFSLLSVLFTLFNFFISL